VDFFEDEMVRLGYDWKQVVAEYLFSGEEPIFNSIMADRMSILLFLRNVSRYSFLLPVGHPLIHLAYAYEMSSREVAMEALGMASICYNNIHKYLENPVLSQAEASYHSTSLFDIIDKVRSDKKLDGLFVTPGDHNLEKLFENHEALLLDHWNAWNIENPVEQFRESQELATALFAATHKNSTEKYDFFFVHILTTSHAVRVLLPWIPAKFQIPLIRQWWLVTLAIFIAQMRPEINMDTIRDYDLKGRDWTWTAKQAVKGERSTESHYPKALRALQESASTWTDNDGFYLKAAVKFAEEFNGWGGFV
jgi:hypothetical protein